jgi:hypothetical protein
MYFRPNAWTLWIPKKECENVFSLSGVARVRAIRQPPTDFFEMVTIAHSCPLPKNSWPYQCRWKKLFSEYRKFKIFCFQKIPFRSDLHFTLTLAFLCIAFWWWFDRSIITFVFSILVSFLLTMITEILLRAGALQ